MTALTKNSDYWKDRAIENEKNARTTAEIGEAELRAIFSETSSKIQKEVDYWWNRFAKNNSLTISEAKKLMSNKELDELNWDVKEYIKNGIEAAITQLPYIESQLENASAKFHINRLNALKIQVLSISNEMFADVDKVVKESMKKVYSDTYYKTAFNIQDAVGIYSDFTRIDNNLLEKIVSKPWAEDGSNFSERIWGKYRPKLVNRLHKDLIDCVSRGRNPNEYTQAIAKDFNVSLKQAGDLILSEYNYFNERATQDCLNELDVEEYEILGTLDGVTCATCGGLDGKHYPLKDAVIGINSPPFHPRCRCTTIPYFKDEFTQNEERAYRGEDGKTHYTKAKTYEEWKKEFVKEKGQQAWDYYEKSVKNKATDKEQYKEYKAVLGKNAPKTLEEFQELKYTNYERYRFVKLDYMRQNTLLENPELKLPNANDVTIDDRKFSDYLFNPSNGGGFAKGKAFTSRLGYDVLNYKDLQEEIRYSASRYPAIFKDNNGYGNRYEQKIILYGNRGKPSNVVVGWLCNDNDTKMTSVYIKEV